MGKTISIIIIVLKTLDYSRKFCEPNDRCYHCKQNKRRRLIFLRRHTRKEETECMLSSICNATQGESPMKRNHTIREKRKRL